jgi:membrane protease YdiL (CAAX protease family)
LKNQLNSKERIPQAMKRKSLTEALVALVAFCGLSALSRLFPPVWALVPFSGIAFPLLWAWRTREWARMGFTRRNLSQASLWGLGVGLLLLAIEWFTTEHKAAPFFLLQLAVATPIWLLIMSPFQEFFFRGWLQPRFQDALGLWPGLAVTAITFALWHLCPPFEQAQIVPIMSTYGMFFTLAMGLLFGYIFQRTGSIVAPWLAHVLAGLALVLTGAMTFVQYVE